MKILTLWPKFIFIICLIFNVGLNTSSSSNGNMWIDLNRSPRELQEKLVECDDQDSDDLLEQPYESVNPKLADIPNLYRIKLDAVPRKDGKGNTLSWKDMHLKFKETIGRRWNDLEPSVNTKPQRTKRHIFCYRVWIRLGGPADYSCIGRALSMGKTRTKIKVVSAETKSVEKDILSCSCRPPSQINAEPFYITQYSEEDYFILFKRTRSSNLDIFGFITHLEPIKFILI